MGSQIVLVAPGVPEALKHEQAASLQNALRARCPQARVSLRFCAQMQPGSGACGAQSAYWDGIAGETLFLPLFVTPGQEFMTAQAGFAGPALLQSRFARDGLAAYFSARYRSFLDEGGVVIYLAHGSELPAAATCLREFAAELQRRDRRQFLFTFASVGSAAAGLRQLRPGRVKLVPLTVFYGTGVADVLDTWRETLIKQAGAGIECATERIGLIERDFVCQIWLQLFEHG